jgi:two-component system cell cycle response regulator
MIRLTRKVFSDLAIWMIGLGVLTGIIFPFFTAAMGLPASAVLTPVFFAACIAAGAIVGAANIILAKGVVGRSLTILSDRMRHVESNLAAMTKDGNMDRCRPEECYVDADSEDEIGDSARAFNRLVQSLAFSIQTVGAVRAFTHSISSQLELNALTEKALPQLIQHTNAGAGAILIENDGEMSVSNVSGIRNSQAICKSDHVRRALRTEQPLRVTLPEDVVIEGVLTDFRPREVLVDPIFYKSTALGVIVLASASGFTDDNLSRLSLFREGLALALHNAIMHDRLQHLAALDALTGVFNRHFGAMRLHEEFGRAVRIASPLAVLMFDLDKFKGINDTYGHHVGDRFLAQVVKAVRSVLREGDILVRYGGDEFLAILPAASREDAARVAEHARRKVEETPLLDGEQRISVTISVGGTAYPDLEAKDENDLVKQADKALYTAKEAGRNCVVVA